MLANNYSGPRHMNKGMSCIIISTFSLRPSSTEYGFSMGPPGFYHKYDQLDTIKVTGATVVNIHHATPINPWINYPFIE